MTGSYYLQGDTLQMHARIVDARNRALLYATEPVAGPLKTTAVIEATRQRVRGAIAARFDPLTKDLLVIPPSFEAYREFISGLELFGKDCEEAIRHFQRAAEIDPDFFSPACYIATACADQGEYAKAHAILNRLYERRDRYPPTDRRWLDWHRASLNRRETEALRILRELEEQSPRHWNTKYLIGLSALRQNLPRTTAGTCSQLGFPEWAWRSVTGEWWFNHLSFGHHMLGRYQQELDVVSQTRPRYPDVPRVRVNEVRALAAQHR